MFPAVPLPENSGIRTPIDLKLKPKWRFDAKRQVFTSDSGENFVPVDALPTASRIVYKVPSLAGECEAKLSKHEKDLQRHMQVILPAEKSPTDYVDVVRSWPCVAEAHVAPQFSLPRQA